jgi:hypothetical protein
VLWVRVRVRVSRGWGFVLWVRVRVRVSREWGFVLLPAPTTVRCNVGSACTTVRSVCTGVSSMIATVSTVCTGVSTVCAGVSTVCTGVSTVCTGVNTVCTGVSSVRYSLWLCVNGASVCCGDVQPMFCCDSGSLSWVSNHLQWGVTSSLSCMYLVGLQPPSVWCDVITQLYASRGSPTTFSDPAQFCVTSSV